MRRKKNCKCDFCNNKAVYISCNSPIRLCEDCYTNMSDDFEFGMEDEVGVPFDEYYDFCMVDDDDDSEGID